jgi:hypothetical protein
MFDPDQLRRVVQMHEKSYRLLKWMNSALRRKVLAFDVVHSAMSMAEAAGEWINRHCDNIPSDVRPAKSELQPFANLFSSYLATSFELQVKPRPSLYSPCGCYCSWCSYVAAGSNLKPRRITPGARRDAHELKRVYLRSLVVESALKLGDAGISQAMEDPAIAEDLAWAAYGRELMRRTEFTSQGIGVLVLWRELAWDKKGQLKPKFRLSPERILAAEKRLVDRIAATASH